jgi:hypothetical protein
LATETHEYLSTIFERRIVSAWIESNAKAILALAEDHQTLTEQIRAVGEGADQVNGAVISLVSVILLRRHFVNERYEEGRG